MKKDISANLCQKCLIPYSKILLNVLHNTVLLPWQHTGFQTSPILKAVQATFGISLSYLQILPCMHNPAHIKYVGPSFNIFHIEIKWVGIGRVNCQGNKIFIAIHVGPFPVELLAYQVQWSANWPT